jgi:hypothetical protein
MSVGTTWLSDNSKKICDRAVGWLVIGGWLAGDRRSVGWLVIDGRLAGW